MTTRRCHSCRDWYNAKLRACPNCGTERHAHNKWLRTAALNTHLYEQARAART